MKINYLKNNKQMEQIAEFPKNILNAPKCKFLDPKLNPIPFLLDNFKEDSEDELTESTSINSGSYKSDKELKIKEIIHHKSDNELEISYEN